MKQPVVLCVDDDAGIRDLYQSMLDHNGYEAVIVANSYHAVAVCQFSENVDIAIVNLHMPGMDGFELAERLKSLNPLLPIIMISGAEPELDEMSPFIDAAIRKGASVRAILDRIELLLAECEARPVEPGMIC